MHNLWVPQALPLIVLLDFLMLFLVNGRLHLEIFYVDHSETFQEIEMSSLRYKNNPSQTLRLRNK